MKKTKVTATIKPPKNDAYKFSVELASAWGQDATYDERCAKWGFNTGIVYIGQDINLEIKADETTAFEVAIRYKTADPTYWMYAYYDKPQTIRLAARAALPAIIKTINVYMHSEEFLAYKESIDRRNKTIAPFKTVARAIAQAFGRDVRLICHSEEPMLSVGLLGETDKKRFQLFENLTLVIETPMPVRAVREICDIIDNNTGNMPNNGKA